MNGIFHEKNDSMSLNLHDITPPPYSTSKSVLKSISVNSLLEDDKLDYSILFDS